MMELKNFFKLGVLSALLFFTGNLGAQTVDTVCNGDIPAGFVSLSLASGSQGDTSYVYLWEDSISGGTWAPASGVNNDTIYQAGGLSQTTYFRRRVEVLNCGEISYSNPIEVMVLDSLVSVSNVLLNANCPNTADGEVEVLVTGGLAPYTYSWENGGTDSLGTDLSTGFHVYTITDAFGCGIVDSVFVDFDNPLPEFEFDIDTIKLASEFGTTISANSGYASYQWSNGSTDSTTTVSESGLYYLTVTNDAGCEAFDSIYVIVTVGIASTNNQIDVEIFPNPARSTVRVEVGNNSEVPESLIVTNITGQEVMRIRNTSSLDVSAWPSGVYYISVEHKGLKMRSALVVQ